MSTLLAVHTDSQRCLTIEPPIVTSQLSRRKRTSRDNVPYKVRIVDTVIMLRSEKECQALVGKKNFIVFSGPWSGRTPAMRRGGALSTSD